MSIEQVKKMASLSFYLFISGKFDLIASGCYESIRKHLLSVKLCHMTVDYVLRIMISNPDKSFHKVAWPTVYLPNSSENL